MRKKYFGPGAFGKINSSIVARYLNAAGKRDRIIKSMEFFGNEIDSIIVASLLRSLRPIRELGPNAILQMASGVAKVWAPDADQEVGFAREDGLPFGAAAEEMLHPAVPVRRRTSERDIRGYSFILLSDAGQLMAVLSEAQIEDIGKFIYGESFAIGEDVGRIISGEDVVTASGSAGLLVCLSVIEVSYNAGILSFLDLGTLSYNAGILSWQSSASIAAYAGLLGGISEVLVGDEGSGFLGGRDSVAPLSQGLLVGGADAPVLSFGPHETYGWIYQDEVGELFVCGDFECASPCADWTEDYPTRECGSFPNISEDPLRLAYHSASKSMRLSGNGTKTHTHFSGLDVDATYKLEFWGWCIGYVSHPIIIKIYNDTSPLLLTFEYWTYDDNGNIIGHTDPTPPDPDPPTGYGYYSFMKSVGGMNVWTQQRLWFTAPASSLKLEVSSFTWGQTVARYVDDFSLVKV